MSWKGHCKNALFALALTSLIAPQAEAIEIFMGANAATLHPQEYVAGRLREALAHHDSLPVVLMLALSHIWLKHRHPGFLDLQEYRIVVCRHEKSDPAEGADAAYPDSLNGEVKQVETIEQRPNVFRQRGPVAAQGDGRLGEAGTEQRNRQAGCAVNAPEKYATTCRDMYGSACRSTRSGTTYAGRWRHDEARTPRMQRQERMTTLPTLRSRRAWARR
jgi:hypothetical protein